MFPFPLLPDSTEFINIDRYYPVKEFSQILNLAERDIPKVFIQILVYKTKNINTNEESLYFTSFGKIKRQGNISTYSTRWYKNDLKGEAQLIGGIKETLYNNIDRMAFSKNPFNTWIGEIIEVFPNGDVKIKLYDDSSIQSNLLLDAEIMYCLTIDGHKKWKLHGIKHQIHDLQLGIDYIEGGWPGANPTDNDYFSRKLNFISPSSTIVWITAILRFPLCTNPPYVQIPGSR